MVRKPVVLVILSGGGFSFEAKTLLAGIRAEVDFIYLTTPFGGTPGENDIPAGESHPVPSFATKSKTSPLRSVAAFVQTFGMAFWLNLSRRIDCIIGVGCSHSVPMLLAGRICNRRNVYIESITRVDQLSVTGKIIYRLGLAQTFIVQWPGLQTAYPASQLGTIL